MNNANTSTQIQSNLELLVGRLFTLGGSVLFLIGSLIAAVLAYRDYENSLGTG